MTQNTATKTEGARSRIDGALHRNLPAQLSIRAAAPDQADDGLLRLRLSVSSETPYLRASWWDDPWMEVLGHKDGEVDLTRLNDGAPVLANHDRHTAVGNTPLAGIGTVERAWLEGGRMMADLVISRREALADLRQDIIDGLVRNVSIGYMINERVLTKANGDGAPDEYRVTNWTPFEISPVDIPADATVGLGRSADEKANSTPQYRVVDITPARGTTTKGVLQMPEEIIAPAASETTAPQTRSLHVEVSGVDPLAGERERMREIRAMGRQLGASDLADAAIDNGTSIDGFRAQLVSRMVDKGQLRPAEDPNIGMSKNDLQEYSFCRALLAASDPLHATKLAPFEVECSRAAQDKRGDSRDKTREAAITIPVDMLWAGMRVNESVAAAATRMLISRAKGQSRETYRDLTVGSATAGGNLVATELLGSSFIELLRNAMVIDKLGVTWLRDLNGNIAIPSQTGAGTGYWVAENVAATESAQTVGQVTMSPKTVGAFTDYSRRLLLQSSIDVEAFVRADLAMVIGLAMQLAAIQGGGSNEPTGIIATSGIGSVAGGTNGAAPTYAHMVDLETALGNANADAGNLAYLTNSKVRGKLRKTEEFASTNGRPVWTSMPGMPGVGEVLGYSAYVSNSVPSDLTKGTASGVCSATIFGNWSDLLIGMWGGLDVMLDPYAGATAGTKRVIALQDCDVAVRHVASFAAMLDGLTT